MTHPVPCTRATSTKPRQTANSPTYVCTPVQKTRINQPRKEKREYKRQTAKSPNVRVYSSADGLNQYGTRCLATKHHIDSAPCYTQCRERCNRDLDEVSKATSPPPPRARFVKCQSHWTNGIVWSGRYMRCQMRLVVRKRTTSCGFSYCPIRPGRWICARNSLWRACIDK